MQSVQQQVLEKQIEQLFIELVSIWKESDTKKIQSVKALAARMEELYEQMGIPINSISADITRRLKAVGITTAHHVHDYLDDKYKRDYNAPEQITDSGEISLNNLLEQRAKANPFDLEAEEKRQLRELLKKRQSADEELTKAIEQAAQVQKQALDYNTDTFSSTTQKQYEKSSTVIPNKQYRGPVHEAMSLLVEDLGKYYYDMKETLDDVERWYDPEKLPEREFKEMIDNLRGYMKDVRKIIAPAKDLKFATSRHNWFHTLLKFLSHGKHAAAVMTSIPSARHLRTLPDGTQVPDKRPLTREQVGDIMPEIEDLLQRFAESKIFLNHVVSFLRRNGEYDRDDRILRWRREFCEKLVRYYADDGDFFNHISIFREKTMDQEVAARRIDARETLSDLA